MGQLKRKEEFCSEGQKEKSERRKKPNAGKKKTPGSTSY